MMGITTISLLNFTAIIGSAVVGLLLAILLVMFLVYRLRRREPSSHGVPSYIDEGEIRSKTPMIYNDHQDMFEYS